MEEQDFTSYSKELKEVKEQLRELEKKISPFLDAFNKTHEDVSSIAPLTPKLLSSSRDSIFVCYSHKDKKSLDRFLHIFVPAIKRRNLPLWSEDLIAPGAIRMEEIQKALACTKVAILLVSADFLKSDCVIIHSLLEVANQKELTLLWIAVSYCCYEETEIAHYEPFNDPKKPLVTLRTYQRDEIFLNMCKHVIKIMKNNTSK